MNFHASPVGSESRLPSSPGILGISVIISSSFESNDKKVNRCRNQYLGPYCHSVCVSLRTEVLSQPRECCLCSEEFCSAEISLVVDAFCNASSCLAASYKYLRHKIDFLSQGELPCSLIIGKLFS